MAEAQHLAAKIREYIHTVTEPVALEILVRRGERNGYSKRQVLEAMRYIHRMKDIRQRHRLGTIYYDPVPLHTFTPAPRLRAGDYPKRDETNNCEHEIFTYFDEHNTFAVLFMTPEERERDQFIKQKERERELLREV